MQHRFLVFTDLDGSLLDHHSYSFAPALPLLKTLSEDQVPVIPVTSKTRAELLDLRSALNNQHPFVVENGAAIFIPQDYFPDMPLDCYSEGEFLCHSFSEPRSHWQTMLQKMKAQYEGEFITFQEAGVEGIIEMTGLPADKAQLANQRDFSEPVKWLGSEARRAEFIQQLQVQGATVLQGGRFLHVLGDCDKGKALSWLAAVFEQAFEQSVLSIAAGDSYNDIAMLDAADAAVVIRSPVQSFPEVMNNNSYKTEAFGPNGWVEGIEYFMTKFATPS